MRYINQHIDIDIDSDTLWNYKITQLPLCHMIVNTIAHIFSNNGIF